MSTLRHLFSPFRIRKMELANRVVIAVGMRPHDGLKKTLEERGIRHHIVGDASEVRRIIEATEEGARAAWDI